MLCGGGVVENGGYGCGRVENGGCFSVAQGRAHCFVICVFIFIFFCCCFWPLCPACVLPVSCLPEGKKHL